PARPAQRLRRGLPLLVGPRGDAGDRRRRRGVATRSGRSSPPGCSAGRCWLPWETMSDDEKVRLGGMALPNGVLVHGPNSWACAIRAEDGRIEVASALKRFRATRVSSPFLRGPARLVEAMALLPQVKRALPKAQLPMQNRRVVSAMVGAAVVV